MNTPGMALVLAYILVHFSLPPIYLLGFDRPDYSIYAYEWHYLDLVFAILLPLAVVLNPWRLVPRIKNRRKIGRGLAQSFSRVEFFAAIVCLCFAFLLKGSSLLSFRYGYTSISDHGLSIYALLAIKTFLRIALVWSFFLWIKHGQKLRVKSQYAAIMFAVAGFLTGSGTADYFLFSFLLAVSIWPRVSHNLMTLHSKRLFSFAFLSKIIYVSIPLVFLVVAVALGDIIKETAGIQEKTLPLIERLNEIGLKMSGFLSRVVEGLSTHFYALNGFHREFIQEELKNYNQPFSYIWEGLKYRVSLITGSESVERPFIQSISKLNFEVLSYKISEREGTSPGLFAGFSYVFPNFVGLVLALAYVEWLRRLVDGALKGINLSPLAIVMMLLVMLGVFQSPFDFFVLIDNGAIWFFMIILLLQGMPHLKQMRNG